MKITPHAMCSLLLPLFILAGCGKPSTVGKSAPDAAPEAAPADAAAPEAAAQAGQTEPTTQKCLAENYKLEASRRWKEVQLEPLFIEAGLHSSLVSLIGAVTEAGAGKKFDTVEGHVAKAWQEMKRLRPSTSDGDLDLMKNIAVRRLVAYASCRAVASRDSSWCLSIQDYEKNSVASCNWNYASFVIIGDEAILKGKSCEEASGGFKGIPHDELLAACQAVKGKKPEQCPWDATSPPGAICRAAAKLAAGNDCQKITGKNRAWDAACCDHFAWRFANVASGHADPYVIPEGGALSGDEQGCMRALKWGLMEDLGALFGLEVAKKKPEEQHEDELYSEYLCSMIIYWSQREPPGM